IPSLADGAVAVKQDGEVNREFLEERSHAQVDFGDIDRNDGNWLVAGRRRQLLQRTDLAYTWLAPRRKEMQQNDLAGEVLQPAPPPAQIIQREVRFPGPIPDFQRGWRSALRRRGGGHDGRRCSAGLSPSGRENRKVTSVDWSKAENATGFRIYRTLNRI